ncbi:hypothetical protein [Thermaurantiacus sp.]
MAMTNGKGSWIAGGRVAFGLAAAGLFIGIGLAKMRGRQPA